MAGGTQDSPLGCWPVSDTFTCASCGDTREKGWSDEEAAAEAQQNFPGIDLTDPDEAPVVCDSCYEHIMGRVQAEAPQLIGEGWREASEQFDRERGVSGRCYKTAGGSAVHVKPACRCRR